MGNNRGENAAIRWLAQRVRHLDFKLKELERYSQERGRIAKVPQAQYIEKVVEVPKVVTGDVEKIVEVPHVEYIETVVHVPKVLKEEAEKIVKMPQAEYVGKT
eukprot:1522735-Pyramimonas_sp.AAC.1